MTGDDSVTDGDSIATGESDTEDHSDTEDDSTVESVRSAVSVRRVANVVGLLLLVAFLLPFLIYAVPQAVGAEHSFVVLSSSMEPTLAPGDVILVDDVPAERIQAGDIISFSQQGEVRTTTHRVIEVTESDGQLRFRTKGDANEDPDRSLVAPAQVEGRILSIGGYLFVIPLIGYVIQFSNTQTGVIALVLVPLTLLVVNEIWQIVSSTRQGSDDTKDGADPENQVTHAMTEESQLLLEHGQSDGGQGESDTTSTDSNEDSGITLRPVELRFGLVTLVAFTIYSSWVAYVTLETWSIGVAVSVGVATFLLAGLYFFGGSETPETDEPTTDDSQGGVRIRYGTPADETTQQTVQPVAEFETLVEMARRTGSPIIRNEDEEVSYLSGATALYRLDGPAAEHWESLRSNGEGQEPDAEADNGADGPNGETVESDDAPEDHESDENGDGMDQDDEVAINWTTEPHSDTQTNQSVDIEGESNDD
jgi:signal peptidase